MEEDWVHQLGYNEHTVYGTEYEEEKTISLSKCYSMEYYHQNGN